MIILSIVMNIKKVTHYKIYSWMYSPDLGVVEDKFVYVGMISKELKN